METIALGDLARFATDITPAEPFPFVPASFLTAEPTPLNWLIRGILEADSLNMLWGESTAGKSLFVLDWAFCLAAGLDWEGISTEQCDVVIIAGEGFAGMGRRLRALEIKYGMKAPESLIISRKPAQLLDPSNALWVADSIRASCRNPGLIVVDTMHRNMQGDENSSVDIGVFLGNLDAFFRTMGATIVVVHHTGHNDPKRSRGSSALRPAMDGEFSVTKSTEGYVTLACHKSKDFEPFQPMQFRLDVVPLDGWLDDEGEPLTSVVLKSEGETPIPKRRKLSARDDLIVHWLYSVIETNGVPASGDIKSRFGGFAFNKQVVHIDHWRDAIFPLLDVDKPESRQKAFKRARDKLFQAGAIRNWGDYWWPVDQDRHVQVRTLSVPVRGSQTDRHGHTPKGVSVCPAPQPSECVVPDAGLIK